MSERLTVIDKLIIRELQGDIPLVSRPFLEIAERIGISEGELLERIRELVHKGLLRRIGAILYHQKAGIVANAMCAWKIPEDRVDIAGKIAASFAQVSHCYRRKAYPQWPYNLYTMVHASSDDECNRIITDLTRRLQPDDVVVLFSTEELKKTSMNYVV